VNHAFNSRGLLSRVLGSSYNIDIHKLQVELVDSCVVHFDLILKQIKSSLLSSDSSVLNLKSLVLNMKESIRKLNVILVEI
jgi:hypothetical protein